MEIFKPEIKDSIQQFLFHLADNNLILSHRLSELCGHGPELEQDIAVTNIALDLLGQSQFYFQLLSQWEGESRNEDELAFLRSENAYKHLILVEQPHSHFGDLVVRQFLFDQYHVLLLKELQSFPFKPLQDIVQKALPEVKYHLNWSSQWVITLGDGTDESKEKMEEAFYKMWPYALEFSMPAPNEIKLQKEGFLNDYKHLKEQFLTEVREVLHKAKLEKVISFIDNSEKESLYQSGGKLGRHSENLGYILAEMQYMQRLYPNCEW